jgi:hypothetical protein
MIFDELGWMLRRDEEALRIMRGPQPLGVEGTLFDEIQKAMSCDKELLGPASSLNDAIMSFRDETRMLYGTSTERDLMGLDSDIASLSDLTSPLPTEADFFARDNAMFDGVLGTDLASTLGKHERGTIYDAGDHLKQLTGFDAGLLQPRETDLYLGEADAMKRDKELFGQIPVDSLGLRPELEDIMGGIGTDKFAALSEIDELHRFRFDDFSRFRPSPIATVFDDHLASGFYQRLQDLIIDFERDLDDESEVGVRLVNFGQAVTFHLSNIGYWNPSTIWFEGETEGGDAVKLIQNVTQVNVLLMKLPRRPDVTRKPIGFTSRD